MTQHTKEPWKLANLECHWGTNCPGHVDIEGADGNTVNPAPYLKDSPDAARIVACVNACQGINPNVVPALIKDIQGMMQALALNRPEEEILKDYGMLGIHNIRAVKDSLEALKATK